MIFDRSFELLKAQRIDSVVKYGESSITVIVDGKEHEFTLNDHTSRKSLRLENL